MNGKSLNLRNQVDKIFKEDNQKSIKTRYRYKDAEYRFCDWLGVNTSLKKLKNVKAKHIYCYTKYLQEKDYSPAYIYVELSGIRYFHTRTGSSEILPENKKLNLERRIRGNVNRSWSLEEIERACSLATEMKRIDVVKAIKVTNGFGLRLEEAIVLIVKQVKDAIKTKELYLSNTKGKHPRTVPVETDNQLNILYFLLQNSATDERIFISRGKYTHLIKKSIQDWIRNHRNRFQDDDRVSSKDARMIVKLNKVFKVKSIPKSSLSIHGNRHSYARNNYLNNINKGLSENESRLEVSELLGHHRVDVTRIYTNK